MTSRSQLTRPAPLVALVLCLAGLGISIYLTAEHYGGNTSLACPESATINCLKVTTSRWSTIAGVPVAVLGLVFFVVMTVLVVLPAPAVRRVRIVAAAIGVVTALYLVCIELFAVDAICLWCTAVHVLTLALFAAVAWPERSAVGAGAEAA